MKRYFCNICKLNIRKTHYLKGKFLCWNCYRKNAEIFWSNPINTDRRKPINNYSCQSYLRKVVFNKEKSFSIPLSKFYDKKTIILFDFENNLISLPRRTYSYGYCVLSKFRKKDFLLKKIPKRVRAIVWSNNE